VRFVAFIIKPQMACHDIGWVLGARVRFGSLDLAVTAEGDLERAPALVPPSPATGLVDVN
jgi:hypothetical protein